MSKENVEIVKRIFEGWSEGDFRPGREAFSDDVVFVADDPVLGRTPCHGLSEVTAYTREYLSSWSHVRHVAQEIIDCGDRVFVAERHIGVGKHSEVKSEEQLYAVWTLRDRKVVRFEHFRDRGDALDAAGLKK